LNENTQPLRTRYGVVVEIGQNATPGDPSACIAGSGESEFGFVNVVEAIVVPAAIDHGAGGVRRGVIDDDRLEVPNVLSEQAVDRLP
jgi:hypothetical protein